MVTQDWLRSFRKVGSRRAIYDFGSPIRITPVPSRQHTSEAPAITVGSEGSTQFSNHNTLHTLFDVYFHIAL